MRVHDLAVDRNLDVGQVLVIDEGPPISSKRGRGLRIKNLHVVQEDVVVLGDVPISATYQKHPLADHANRMACTAQRGIIDGKGDQRLFSASKMQIALSHRSVDQL